MTLTDTVVLMNDGYGGYNEASVEEVEVVKRGSAYYPYYGQALENGAKVVKAALVFYEDNY